MLRVPRKKVWPKTCGVFFCVYIVCCLLSISVNFKLKGKINLSVISTINLLLLLLLYIYIYIERERERERECKMWRFLQFKIPGLSSKCFKFLNLMAKACCVKCWITNILSCGRRVLCCFGIWVSQRIYKDFSYDIYVNLISLTCWTHLCSSVAFLVTIVKLTLYKPGQYFSATESWGSQNIQTFGTERW